MTGLVLETLAAYAEAGYAGSFQALDDGSVLCLSCHGQARAQDVSVEALRRVEGASDPDAMAAVMALVCPDCHAKGTLVVQYGTEITAGEATLLEHLQDRRIGPGVLP